MYSQEVISSISERIAFSNSLNPDFPVELSDDNSTGTSGRKFESFHQLVTIDNIYASVKEIDMDEELFNEYLKEMKMQTVLEVLPKIFDSNTQYIDATDYSNVITAKASLIDECIGYSMASKVIELLITTQRINSEERSNKLSYSALKIELDGVRNDKGFLVSKGIIYKMNSAIKRTSKIIFPVVATITSKPW